MPNVNDLKDSKFLTKEDVGSGTLVTIAGYKEQDVSMEDQPQRIKWTLSFDEFDKDLVLNVTNGNMIQAITKSGEFKDWIGKQIVLWNDPTVGFAGKITGGIRVRPVDIAQTIARPVSGPPVATEADLAANDDEIPF